LSDKLLINFTGTVDDCPAIFAALQKYFARHAGRALDIAIQAMPAEAQDALKDVEQN
jgi:hypothetical protein